MTNYVEEMMKTAGVYITKSCKNAPDAYCWDCDLFINNECKSEKILHCPDFTAEKQLEIIKLIGANFVYFYYYSELDRHELTVELVDNRSIYGTAQDFAQALAQLTTELMNAGELDKSRVKDILEG